MKRVIQTPISKPLRVIGSDYHLTVALIAALTNKPTLFEKIKRLFKL